MQKSGIVVAGAGLFGLAQGVSAQTETMVLEEITVTARYREENAQDIGQAITALGAQQLADLGIQSASDLARAMPSLELIDRGPNRNDISIRGMGRLLSLQDLLPVSALNGSYIDDVPVNTLGGAQIDVRTFDLSRIEVLRGPQGTLYGEGSMGGTIRYITADPDLSAGSGRIEVGGTHVADGDFGQFARGLVNAPLAESAAVRLAASYANQGGFIDSPQLQQKDANDFEYVNARAVLLWKPTDALTLRLLGARDEADIGNNWSVSGDPDDLRSDVRTQGDRVNDDHSIASLNVSYRWPSLTLTSISSYFDRKVDRDIYDSISATVASIATLTLPPLLGSPVFIADGRAVDSVEHESYTQELRLVSDFGGHFDFVLGGFFKHVDSRSVLDLTSQGILQAAATAPIIIQGSALTRAEQVSVFGEITWRVAPTVRIIGGLRHHDEDLDSRSRDFISGFPVPVAPGAFTVIQLANPNFAVSTSIEKVLPKLAVEWNVADTALLYASYSEGARNGGLNSPQTLATIDQLAGPGASRAVESYKEDSVQAYEIGAKTQWLDRRLTLNGAIYRDDWEDLQVTVAVPPLGFGLVRNASAAESLGAELELMYAPSEHWQFSLGGNWTRAELTEALTVNELTGASVPKSTRIPYVPKYSFSTGIAYETPVSFAKGALYVRGDYSYSGSATTTLNGIGWKDTDSFGFLNAAIGLRADGWEVEVRGENLLNKIAVVARNHWDETLLNLGITPPQSLDETFVTRPRTLMLTLRKDF